MSDDVRLPSNFEGSVRLFPLPNAVLFPQVMMPLHIFEPRYRQMTADALAGDRLIAMALLKPDQQTEDVPALHPVVCVGKIIADQRLEDGRYNLLLRGLSRARILEEKVTLKLYRIADVALLDDASPATGAEELHALLAGSVRYWVQVMGLAQDQMAKLLNSDLPMGTLVDVLSFALPVAVEVKQELLEELNVERRLRRLLTFLDANEPRPHASPPPSGRFPPDFSTN
jgi:Lon protease-like protein